MSKTAHIATFGCQMNAYDSERMAGLLAKMGYARAQGPDTADLIILNTCSVRQRAEQKVYSYVGELKRLKAANPDLIIGVGGCVAQQEGASLLKRLRHLDFVFGTGALERLPELVSQAAEGYRMADTGLDAAPSPEIIVPARPGLKALVTVMTGCDNFCSYCVVPHVRGRERSRPADQVLAEVSALSRAGVREVTLLGQNVNSYQDPDSGLDFAGLLERVNQLPELWRIRFTTSHPKDLGPRLMEALAGLDKVMEQLHLPAQSGSDRVLQAMNRGYTRAQYLERVAELRALLPGLALGGDIIAGFPGESEDEFNETLSLLAEVRYDFLYSFMYSDRPFTRAGRLSGKLSEEAKRERLVRLQALQREIGLEEHGAQVGRVVEVLVEGPAKKGEGLMSGRCRAGRAVNFPGPPELAGRLARVRITEGREHSLLGELESAGEVKKP
ncbi:MAG: tRNA (N6-isopentenyl adenosine(37)-C2)-methylthiotransferase MiaB [Desulfarculaceae bacterium]|nr:tRNA (N6-isopentenyl adenosine(37)-C2)-methylthiotransferase MiaB [Desulfarculaceae bacterium]MCF8070926.1 tRNA (N6-isopentenyl adenosine(37)-C2)-methylthiotransferase MiaB [Desulfarculaceae bacterium]MCF8100514.1 tRNA (N6-isopentenyl adenosine(37)-C2)-methylthiotransferase MiaB [Desulfarculaceae bacterium]MCF8116540.1 tRNA (N6-isopentenyl adenosine(37)-C2)-methylthiotransferase MiaB [Desulfarculaceae bacterium]